MSDEPKNVTSQALVDHLEANNLSDDTRLEAARQFAKSKPSAKPGEVIVQLLVATGSGEARTQRVRDFVEKMPDSSADECLDFMIGNSLPQGTIEKVGKFLRGTTYVYRPSTGTSTDNDKITNLLRENAEIKSQLAQANSDLIVEKKKNTRLQQQLNVVNANNVPEQVRQSEQLGVGKPQKRETALAGAK